MKKNRRILSISALLLLARNAPAIAQDSAPPQDSTARKPGQLEEIVVTAQKRSDRLGRVPLSVQAVSGKELARAGVHSVTDLVRLVPTASVVNNSSAGLDTVEIRGIASGYTGDNLIGYYIDDTPFSIPNLQLTPPARLLDVQQVEVIRGPSGTIYGQGSAGGTIKIVTNKPDLEQISGTLGVEYSGTQGGHPNEETDFTLNLPVIKDIFALRISGSYESLGGYAHSEELPPADGNGIDLKNIRTAARIEPSDDVTIDATYWHIENSQDNSNNLTPRAAPANLLPLLTGIYTGLGLSPAIAQSLAERADARAFPYQPIGDDTIAGTDFINGFTNLVADIGSLAINWQTAAGTVTFDSSYIQHKIAYIYPVVGYLVSDFKVKTDSATEELRIASDADSAIHYIAGATYRGASSDYDLLLYGDERIFGLPGHRVDVLDTIGPLDTQSYAVFGEISEPLFGNLIEPLFGIRYFSDDRSASTFARNTGVTTNVAANFNQVSPRFNLKLNAAENGIVFFNAARGFRSGVLQTPEQVEQAAATGVKTGLIVSPDTLWTYELGTRWTFFGKTLAFDSSIYHTDWKNIQTPFVGPSSLVSVATSGNAGINGVDATLRWLTPVPGLSFAFEGGYLDARYTQVNTALEGTTAVHPGGALPNVPRATSTLSTSFQRDLPALLDARLDLDAAYAFRGDQIDAASGLRSANQNDVSLRLSLSRGPYRAEVFGLNVLNSVAPTLREQFSEQIPYPRRVGVRFSYQF